MSYKIFVFFSFGGFEQIKLYLVDDNGNLSGGGKLLAGLGAGVLEAVFAVTPMETVKVRFINDQRSANPKFKGFAHGVGCIIKQDGIGGVYKGKIYCLVIKRRFDFINCIIQVSQQQS